MRGQNIIFMEKGGKVLNYLLLSVPLFIWSPEIINKSAYKLTMI